MVHYHDHIKNFGAPNGLCSSITESKHITAVKQPWCQSNKHTALPQMLKSNERLDKLAAARADFTARGMLGDSCLIQAIKGALSITDYDSEDHMDEDASESDETDSDASDEIWASDADHAGMQDFHGELNNFEANSFAASDPDTDTPGGTNPRTPNDHPHPSPPPSPTLPNDEEDDDHGPVESGPLMNEVRLVSRKGQEYLP